MKIRFWDFPENISTFERNQRRWQQHSKCRCFFEQGRSHFEIMLQCSIFLTDTQHRQHSCMIYITYVGCIHIWHKFAANCATGIRDGRAKQRSTKIRFFCSAVAVAEFSVGFSCRPKRRACALRTCFHEFLHVYQVAHFCRPTYWYVSKANNLIVDFLLCPQASNPDLSPFLLLGNSFWDGP